MYNEVDTFYCFLHIMNDLRWREMFKEGMAGIKMSLSFISETLATTYPDVYNHFIEEMDNADIEPYFIDIVMTAFVFSLMSVSPQIATHIFDVFLIEGERAIFQLIIKFIDLQEKEILHQYEDNLPEYLKKRMPFECLKKYPMYQLLDFEASIETAMYPDANPM